MHTLLISNIYLYNTQHVRKQLHIWPSTCIFA